MDLELMCATVGILFEKESTWGVEGITANIFRKKMGYKP